MTADFQQNSNDSDAGGMSTLRRARVFAWFAIIVIGVLVVLAYSNSSRNALALDDWHSIEQNPYVRSLSFIPRYFRDPATFSVLARNVDYRPVLQTTYALNYALAERLFGDGYDMRVWHWTNMLLHFVVAFGLFLVGRLLIGERGLAPVPGIRGRDGELISLGAAIIFAVHPMTTGCLNYLSARSSLLTAAFLMPALALYLARLAGRARPWTMAVSLLLYVLAMLTKVEAVPFCGVLVLADALFAPGMGDTPLLLRPFKPGLWVRCAPFFVVTVVFLVVWKKLSPLQDSSTRAAYGMTSGVYLLTQVRAWWYYIAEVLAPVRLVADESAYPISGVPADPSMLPPGSPPYSLARAVMDPRVWLAGAGWLGVFAVCVRLARSVPIVPFFVGMFLLMLSPTSSVVALAEMVNEHRPYLPVAGLFLLGAVGLWLIVARLASSPRLVFSLICLVLTVPLIFLTRERNLVWRTDLSLWGDTASKSPESGRAQMNYGLALMRRGRYDEAEDRFRRALALTPNYSYVHSNLGILLAAKGDIAGSKLHHDKAVSLAPQEANPYYWRGRTRAKQGDTAGAVADFQAAVDRNPTPFNEAAALAAALTRAGRAGEAASVRSKYETTDPKGFLAQFNEIIAIFPSESAISLNNRGVELMKQAKYAEAEVLFQRALSLDTKCHLAMSNLGVLSAAKGDQEAAVACHDAAIKMAPGEASPWYWRGRYYAQRGDLEKACESLKAADAAAGHGPRETGALIECLVRLKREDEVGALLAAAKAAGTLEPVAKERASFALAVFGK